MPVEIKELVVKATVENKVENQKESGNTLQIQNVNLELLLKKLSREIKSTNER